LQPVKRDPMFLIVAGTITALFLPFAIALPPSLALKAGAIAALMLAAGGISALVLRLRRKKE
jgi:hypothetical protein